MRAQNKHMKKYRGAWLVQSEKHVTLDLEIMRLSPMLGVDFTYTHKILKKERYII